MCNELKGFDVSSLVEKYGAKRVEATMIFIERSMDHRGLLVSMPVTKARVEAVLEAVYGKYE